MSTGSVALVPRPTGFVPAPERIEAGVALLEATAAGAVRVVRHRGIELFDCGENFSGVLCPHCGAEIDDSRWGDMMSADYVATSKSSLPDEGETGFQLKAFALPCCGKTASVDQLAYRWPMAFGRFGLVIERRDAVPGDGDLERLEAALGCELTMVEGHW
ncbi:hypothetical protein [Pelagibacterium mangrovi]|uniref:hypothetical protein n=1 Tax=Pelagibacterium mangrovi TaxID=3119828 RepID=UPI002FCA7436